MKRTTEQSNRPSHRGQQLELTGERESATGRPTSAVRNQSATLFCANKQESSRTIREPRRNCRQKKSPPRRHRGGPFIRGAMVILLAIGRYATHSISWQSASSLTFRVKHFPLNDGYRSRCNSRSIELSARTGSVARSNRIRSSNASVS